MIIEQTVTEIVEIKRMMHARATSDEVQRYIDGRTNREAVYSMGSRQPLYYSIRPAGTGLPNIRTN